MSTSSGCTRRRVTPSHTGQRFRSRPIASWVITIGP